MRVYEREVPVLGRMIRMQAQDTGKGLQVLITGGDQAHIGAVAVCGESSFDSSFPEKNGVRTVTFPGHKETQVVENWARRLGELSDFPVVVSAGIHYDGINRAQIGEILSALDKELSRAAAWFSGENKDAEKS